MHFRNKDLSKSFAVKKYGVTKAIQLAAEAAASFREHVNKYLDTTEKKSIVGFPGYFITIKGDVVGRCNGSLMKPSRCKGYLTVGYFIPQET